MSGPMRFLTALAWMLAAWLVPVGSPAAAEIPIIVERLDATGVDTFEQVRAAPEAAWRAAPDGRLRRGQEPTWWRVRVPGPAAPAGEPLVLVLDDAFTAVVAAHVPPDHAPRVASRIDPDLRQPGSRHSLVFVVPGDLGDAHVHLELRAARAIPITPRLMAEEAHLARDLTRVRYSTAINVALLLFGLVAAIYAVALGRYAMLLLVAYCGLAAAYLLAISGELAALPGGAALMPESLRIAGIASSLSMLFVYGFFVRFLELDRAHPRVRATILSLLAAGLPLFVWYAADPNHRLTAHLLNLLMLALMLVTTFAALLRIRAGSAQGWFYLLAWAPVNAIIGLRLWQFLHAEPTAPWMEFALPGSFAFAALVLVLVTARAARYAEVEMQVARRSARTDPLTGLPNRAFLDSALASAGPPARGPDGAPLAVMFIDLDHFKAINDGHGHDVGDRCLVAVAEVLRRMLRREDLVARYGGEEFVLAIRGIDEDHASTRAEAIRAAIAATRVASPAGELALTASIGVAVARPDEPAAEVLRRADLALYAAKRAGRDRVVFDRDTTTTTGAPA